MAKRRNPKKEKALRNQAYARKFRKRSSGRFSRNRRYGNNSSSGGDDESNSDESEETENSSNN